MQIVGTLDTVRRQVDYMYLGCIEGTYTSSIPAGVETTANGSREALDGESWTV